MKPARKKKVLVLMVLTALIVFISWTSGCAGLAEPLPSLQVSPSSLSITAAPGSASSQNVSVTNMGTIAVQISQASISGAGFSLSGLTPPLTLKPGQSQIFSVRFAAAGGASVDGTLSIITDAHHRPVVLRMHGKGGSSAPGLLTISPASANPSPNGKIQFTAIVGGQAPTEPVRWATTMGTITSTGLYTAPSNTGIGTVTASILGSSAAPASATVAVTSASSSGPSGPSSPTVTSVTISPTSASLTTGATLPFAASVQGTVSDKSVTWQASAGSITTSGVYVAPANAGTAVVTATSNADPTKSASAVVTITASKTPAPIGAAVTSVTVSPSSASSITGGTIPFAASVQGTTSNKSVAWRALLGSITSSGVYTAPSKAGTDTVTATSNADSTKSGSSTVAITAAPTTPPPSPVVTSVTVTPGSASASAGGTLTFGATVQGTVSNKGVTWKAALGSITAGGIYTAPSKAGTDTVTATSDADSTKSGSATVAVTAPPSTPPPSNGNAISLLTFGNAGFGGDDTSVFQAALNSTAGKGQTLEIPAGSYNIGPISFPANSTVQVDAGVTVSANAGYGSSDRMLNVNANNVTITGAGATTSVFQMPKARAASQGDGSEYRHCLGIQNATNVTITGIACNQSGGDGIYIVQATSVTVSNCVFDSNFRDGGSVIGTLNHINLTNNTFSNTNGTAPQAGVDIEPNNPGDYLLDVNFTDNTMVNNAGDGLAISLWTLNNTSQPVGITVTRNHSNNNGRYGYFANNDDPTNAPGTVTLNDCTTDQSASDGANARFYAANGANLTFNNLTVTNPHRNGPDPSYGDSAAVAVIRGGGASVPEGNVHYLNVNISVTNGNVDYYFDFSDGSNIGVSNVTFTPGTLSGASKAPPNGILQGQTMNTVGQ